MNFQRFNLLVQLIEFNPTSQLLEYLQFGVFGPNSRELNFVTGANLSRLVRRSKDSYSCLD